MSQFIVRATGSLWSCLIVTVAFAGEIEVQPQPAMPPVGGFSAIENVYEPAPGPIVEVGPIAAPSCATEVVSTCAEPVNICSGSCGHGHGHHCRNCCKKKHFCCLHSTGDMYPHFPYYPEHHGYYYFRPYNYTNVLLHRTQGLQLGATAGNPYSVSMLDPVFEQFALTNISRDADYDRLPPHRHSLPKLEDLLDRE